VAKQQANKKREKSVAGRVSTKTPAQVKKETGLDVVTLEKSFAALAPQADALAKRFYEELFSRYPDVIPLFGNTDLKKQRSKLVAALVLVVGNLRKPEILIKALTGLGKRHQNYGAVADHYGAVKETLLDVMKEFAGSLWTKKVSAAWDHAIDTVAEIMLKAYSPQKSSSKEGETMLANGEMEDRGSNEEAKKLQAILDTAQTALMMIDRDLTITYANGATLKLLQKHEEKLKQLYPGFDSKNIIGTCIDIFHKNPAHQRNLLADPSNLPYETDIHVGPLTFKIQVTAQIDGQGNYTGNTLEWSDVTELRLKEELASRLQSTVDNAQSAMMMIDRDLKITYANKSTVSLLEKHEVALRQLYPGFESKNLIGTCIDMFHKNPDHQRRLLGNPDNLPYITDINVGPLVFNIQVSAIMDMTGNYVGCALEWSDVTELREKEIHVARLQSAIDGAQTNLMLCDNDLVITYVNPAVVAMLRARESELRQRFPGFDVNNLVGQCIDQFHKNPAHQRGLLGNKGNLPANAEIKVGDLEFTVNATAILDHNGNLMGNMVEWRDITEQKQAEHEIRDLVAGAVAGQLDARLDSSNYAGFLSVLSDNINGLMDAIVKPVNEGISVLQSLAAGDLTRTVDGDYQGVFGDFKDGVNTTINNLRTMVSDILNSSGNISCSSNEIAQGNANLSQRTEEQASSLEETASSMEELTGTVKQNADNARQANQLASTARTEAEKGGEVASSTITAMSEINTSSKKIADIIGVIDEIAFQTNLLALNAAVEAARAGEQGRGFAVVASEVRNLAQRSAGAAKEIKSLIKDSVEKVQEGTKLVNESGESLEEIVGSIKKVSDIVAEISAASQEQSLGIEQINKTVVELDDMTQQNAALVEQAAAASASLNDQASGLEQLVRNFNLGESTGGFQSSAPTPVQSRPVAAAKPAVKPKSSGGSEWEEF